MRKILSMLLVLALLLPCFFVTASANELVESGTVELYQLAPENQSLMESYVIKTPNGKLIVIDGGIEGAGVNEDPYLPAALRAIAGVGEGEYFEVEAWFLSHAHADHFYELSKMLNEYNEESNYKINNFYFDFPSYGVAGSVWENALSEEGTAYFVKLKAGFENYAEVNGIDVKDTYYDDINASVVNKEAIGKGLDINIDGVRFEIMQTWDEADGTTELNNTSMIIRMHAAGKTVLFLNDAYIHSGNRLVATYGEDLKSDYVQTAHHGQSGTNRNVYDAVDADFFLWPTPEWIWTNPEGYAIDNVRTWIAGADYSNVRENDLVAGMYDKYPDDPTVVADWADVIDGMKITFENEGADYAAPTPVRYLEYTGEAQTLVNAGSTLVGAMEYSLDGTTFSSAIPTATNAGDYTVYYRIKDGSDILLTKTLTVAIAKVKHALIAPKANALAYTGSAQALVVAGSATSGEMLYSLDGIEYSSEIPTATEKGAYTVYYKVPENTNYVEAAGSVTATIGDYRVTFKNGNALAPFDSSSSIAVMTGEKLASIPSYTVKANTALAYWKIGETRYTTEELLELTFTANTDVYAYFRETAISSCDYNFKTMTKEQFELTAFSIDGDFSLTEGTGVVLNTTGTSAYTIPMATNITEKGMKVTYTFTGTSGRGSFNGHFARNGANVASIYHTASYLYVFGRGISAHSIPALGKPNDGNRHTVEFTVDFENEKQVIAMDGNVGIPVNAGAYVPAGNKIPDSWNLYNPDKNGCHITIESMKFERFSDAKLRKVDLSKGIGISAVNFLNAAQSSALEATSIYMPEGTKVPVKATASMGYELSGWQATSGSFADEKAATTVYTAGTTDTIINATGAISDEWKNYVARIDDAGYESLQAAINAAGDNDTIYLLKDISDNARIYFDTGKNIAVNGNGYTYTDTGSNGDGATAMVVQSSTTVTFTNITLKQTNKNAWSASIPEANRRRVNGFFAINNSGKVIFGDNAVLDGAAGANGAVAWMNGGTSEFVLNGNGAAIRNVDTTYSHGIIAAYDGKAKITIKNGTIENCSSTGGSIIKARSGKSIEITGGKIINNTVSTGAVYAEGDGALVILGNPVIKNNKSGSTEKNVYLADNTFIRVNDNFTGEVGVTSNHVQFAIAGKAGITGLEGFFRDGTSYTGRYYVEGTKYPNDTAKATVEARNAGRELSVIFDYPFSYAAEGEDFLKKGVGAGIFEDAMKNGKVAYLLRDIGLSDVANKGASNGRENYHVNIANKDEMLTVDGNGFELKIADGNYTKKQHVFRLYNQVNLEFRNFIYDGNEFMSFVNAEYVNATNFGGNLTLDNCIVKNCIKGSGGGAIIVTDGKITIKNSVLDSNDSSANGGTIYLGAPKAEGLSTELLIENSEIKNSTGAYGGAIYIGKGTTAIIEDSVIESCAGSNGGTIMVDGALEMTDSTVYGGVSRGSNTNGGGIMVWAEGSTATLTNVVVDSCEGPASGGICVVSGTLELLGNSEIKNCRSSAARAGLSLIGAGTVVIGGNTKITNNKTNANAVANIHNEGTIILADDFKGNLGFSAPGTIEVEEGLTSFAKINTIFLDNDASKYPNIAEDGAITWELIPTVSVATDAGWYYTDSTCKEYASENAGVVRFITTFTAAPSAGCVKSYGTYALSADTNELGGVTSFAVLDTNLDKVATDAAFVVDALGVPSGEEKTVYGISFVTLKNIDTPVYFNTVSHVIDAESKKLVKTEKQGENFSEEN